MLEGLLSHLSAYYCWTLPRTFRGIGMCNFETIARAEIVVGTRDSHRDRSQCLCGAAWVLSSAARWCCGPTTRAARFVFLDSSSANYLSLMTRKRRRAGVVSARMDGYR